jgi:peptide/nickel transport system permease protein
MNYRLSLAGMLLGMILLLSLLAPWLATHDPRHAVPDEQLQPPSEAHPMGTDLLGRDVFSRVLFGGRRLAASGLVALSVAIPPGLLIGLIGGYAGRWIDAALMTLVDALLAFPGLLLAMALITLLGSGSAQIAVAVGIAGLPGYARVVRAAVIEARALPFIEAAHAIGTRPGGILLRHILPTITPPLLAFGGVTLSWAILNSAALIFLGYGGDISAPDWGIMLAEGRSIFQTAPWVALAPGIALSLTVFAINLLASSAQTSGRLR